MAFSKYNQSFRAPYRVHIEANVLINVRIFVTIKKYIIYDLLFDIWQMLIMWLYWHWIQICCFCVSFVLLIFSLWNSDNKKFMKINSSGNVKIVFLSIQRLKSYSSFQKKNPFGKNKRGYWNMIYKKNSAVSFISSHKYCDIVFYLILSKKM